MSDKILNVGIVGTGIFATEKHLPTYESLPQHFKPAAAFNRTKAKAEAFAKIAGISDEHVHDTVDDLIKDPNVDYLDVLLPVQYNFETVKKAIDGGKPVIIEKPIAATMADAKKIVQLDHETKLPILVAENWAYFKAVNFIKERLDKIGPVVSFTYRSTGPFNKTNKYLTTSWRQKPEHLGGFLSDGGVHQLALLTEVLGNVESISALTKQIRQESGDQDILFSTAKLESGVIGTFTYGSSFGAIEKHGSFIIYGLNGSITLEFSAKKPHSLRTLIGAYAETVESEDYFEFEEDSTFGVAPEFENFHEAVTKGDKCLIKVRPEKAFHHLAIVAAALESSKKNGDHVKVEKP